MDLLDIRDLSVAFVTGGVLRPRLIEVVKSVSFGLRKGEGLAIIGESGSGKTTLARAILRIERYIGARITQGSIIFEGIDIARLGERDLRKMGFRHRVSAVFQDPYSSINPFMRIQEVVEEPLKLAGLPRESRRNIVKGIIREVGLSLDILDRHVHELSGGQRQRVALARALVTEPKLLIADEPVSMLDATIRASILLLIREIKRSRGLSLIYITHDIATAKLVADKGLVMYRGRVVEHGPIGDVVHDPKHPYTGLLINAIPDLSRRGMQEMPMEDAGSMTSPSGCVFAPRCPLRTSRCINEQPPMVVRGDRAVACWEA